MSELPPPPTDPTPPTGAEPPSDRRAVSPHSPPEAGPARTPLRSRLTPSPPTQVEEAPGHSPTHPSLGGAGVFEAPIPEPELFEHAQRNSRTSGPPTMHTLSVYDREQLAPRVFAIMFLATFVALSYVMKAFLADAVIAFILVGLFHRAYIWLVPKSFHSRWLASGVTTLLAFLVVVLPTLGVGYLIVTETANAYGVFSNNILTQSEAQTVDEARSRLRELGFVLSRETVTVYVREALTYMRDTLVRWVAEVLSDTLALIGHLGIVLFMVFYMLVDGARLRKFLFDLSPLPDDEDSLILSTFAKVSKGVVVGNGLGSLIQGVAGGLTMWAVGARSPALWGCVMALFSFLPFVGVSAVMLPAAAYFYVKGAHSDALTLIVVCGVMTVFVEHVVKTKMIGSAMRMHDLLVFLTVIGGIGAFGLIGIVYGPLIAMMFITFADLYQSRYRPQLARRFAKSRSI